LKYRSNTKVLTRALETIDYIKQIINELTRSDVIDQLRCSYNYYKFESGRQLEKCHNDYTDDSKKLCEYLKPGPELDQYLKLLDSMELRRIILLHVCKLTNKLEPELLSKSDILNITNCKSTFQNILSDDIKNISDALILGHPINQTNQWGSLLNYVAFNQEDPHILHQILQYPDIQINQAVKAARSDNRGPNIRPILDILDHGRFHCGVLMCAQGHDINERKRTDQPVLSHYVSKMTNAYITIDLYNSYPNHLGLFGPKWNICVPVYDYHHDFYTSDLGNCHKYTGDISGYEYSAPHLLCISYAHELNTPDSKIYRDLLRPAYKYYKLVEHNKLIDLDMNISKSCLLLLTCILGDLYPLIYSKFDISDIINDRLESHGMTYLMLAAYCSNYEVVEYLLKHGADINMNTDLKVLTSAVDFARNNQSIVDLLNGVNSKQNIINVVAVDVFGGIINRIKSIDMINSGSCSEIKYSDDSLKQLLKLIRVNIKKIDDDDDKKLVEDYLKLINMNKEKTNDYLKLIDTTFEIYEMKNVTNKIADYLKL
jgi:hypothetical protein